ncbi:OmpA family protein [Psychroflexus planctonicus]|nr:OmpA family protein [Psychroflexus planctonicus]
MKKIINITFVFLMAVTALQAQDRTTAKADKHFDNFAFYEAAEDYQKIVDKGNGNPYVYRKLAESYYNLVKMKQAERFYRLAMRSEDDLVAEDYFRYAQALKSNAKFDESNQVMQEFAEKAPNDQRAKFFKANPNYLEKLQNKAPNFTGELLELSAKEYSDYGAYERDGLLYFVSTRNESRKTYGWNDQPGSDVFVAQNVGGIFKNEVELQGDVNSNYNEGTIAVTNDGKTMYFTRNDYTGRKYQTNSEGVGQLRLYRASWVSGEWKDVQELEFTDSEYSYSHPALSPDNKHLYFSSNMPGGFGQSDIYRVTLNEDGSFGEPENLGDKINTPGRESFPFIDTDETLYFSTDGHLGLGGLDIFYTRETKTGFSYPTNLGEPVNTKADDFSFSYYPAKKAGYVASNRDGLGTADNIYQLELIQPMDETMLIVSVTDSETKKPIEGVEVIVYDDEENEVKRAATKKDGIAKLLVISYEDYDVQANRKGYESGSESLKAEGNEMPVNISLVPIEPLIIERKVVLDEIYFDFDKFKIIPKSALELDQLIATLKKYDDIRLRVESHTDRRGPEEYNQQLSEKRAKSTVAYMIENGIAEDRLEAVGLGESKPINDCSAGCTEDQHRENRRSEFIIIEEKDGVETKVESSKE